MSDNSGGDEDGGARWEVDDKAQIPKYDLTTSTKVELPECGDRTPSECEVPRVSMRESNGPWAEVECGRRPRAVLEVAS